MIPEELIDPADILELAFGVRPVLPVDSEPTPTYGGRCTLFAIALMMTPDV